MIAYTVRRLFQMLGVLVIGSFALFSVIHLAPGNPIQVLLGPDAPPQQVRYETAQLGLDRPIPVQYAKWVDNAVHGRLGTSIVYHQSVESLVQVRVLPTVQLAIYGVLLALLIGVPVALLGAVKPGSVSDRLGNAYTTLGLSIPSFLLGLVLVVVLSIKLGWFPATSNAVLFWRSPGSMLFNSFLPALTLAILISGIFARFLRASVVSELREDYVRTARAKGLSRSRVLLGHATRNALLPFVTVVGLSVGTLLTGAVVVESVFNYRGLGALMISAVYSRDYPIIQGAGLWIMVLYSFVNLSVDLLYTYIDPRVQLH